MALLYVDSMSHYSTAQIGQKWTSASGATVNATGGRLGTGCLVCDASLSAIASKTLTVGAYGSGGNILTLGFAVKPTSIGSATTAAGIASCIVAGLPLTFCQAGLTLARLVATGSVSGSYVFFLTVLATGALRVVQVFSGDASLGVTDLASRTILQTAPNTLTIGRGAYVELQIALSTASNAVQLRVNGSLVASAALKTFRAQDGWTSITVGGPCTQYAAAAIPAETGIFDVCDLYALDGVSTPTQIPVPVDGTTADPTTYVDFSTFLGAVKVEAVFPYVDATPLQWTPSVAGTHFSLIDSPVSDDSTSVTTAVVSNIDQYAYASPLLAAALPTTGGVHTAAQLALPLLGIQWAWRTVATMSLAASMEKTTDVPANGPQHGSTVATPGAAGWGLSIQTQRKRENSVGGNPTPWLYDDVRATTDTPLVARTRFGSELMA